MKTAAIYVRVSTDTQDVENQLLQLREYCMKSEYHVYKEFVDICSGSENVRPGFNEIFKEAHQHRFDVMVFWALDRFSRSGLSYTVQKLQELKNLSIEWESYQEPFFRTVGPFGDALVGIMATLAKIEKDRISERTKAGLARRKAAGNRLGRPPGSKDKKRRRTKGYYDNNSVAKGLRKKGGRFDPQILAEKTILGEGSEANNRALVKEIK